MRDIIIVTMIRLRVGEVETQIREAFANLKCGGFLALAREGTPYFSFFMGASSANEIIWSLEEQPYPELFNSLVVCRREGPGPSPSFGAATQAARLAWCDTGRTG